MNLEHIISLKNSLDRVMTLKKSIDELNKYAMNIDRLTKAIEKYNELKERELDLLESNNLKLKK